MGTESALFAAKVIDNAFIVLAIELIALAQAADFLSAKENVENELSLSSQKLFREVRQIVPKVYEDFPLNKSLAELIQYIRYEKDEVLDYE
ncbi:MAG: hypothetical protein A3D92_20500 [Bacteroidetes bacterium RIFCSPHIGHO2_02_FULL_44_7]|nr:MAG: hypothetical protein A3D92_20500 [Bacteroidetes bacterium RIFCSPHIGHO2_02_FULL_44_7]